MKIFRKSRDCKYLPIKKKHYACHSLQTQTHTLTELFNATKKTNYFVQTFQQATHRDKQMVPTFFGRNISTERTQQYCVNNAKRMRARTAGMTRNFS